MQSWERLPSRRSKSGDGSLPASSTGPVIAWIPRLGVSKMSHWIKVEKCTIDKPEVMDMAEMLAISQEAAVGHCIRFWCWCDDHQKNGVLRFTDTAKIDAIARIDGFGDAMLKVGWLIMDGTIRVANFDRHLGQGAKTRALSARRMSLKRHRKS